MLVGPGYPKHRYLFLIWPNWEKCQFCYSDTLQGGKIYDVCCQVISVPGLMHYILPFYLFGLSKPHHRAV